MRIERLWLRNFRGVRGELELDFSSPITVLCAPNGTGKTSVCDAAEWLLTGKVHRMRHTLAGAGEDLRNRLSQEPTSAEAEIWNSSAQTQKIRREFLMDGTPKLGSWNSKLWEPYENARALEWLAPLAPRPTDQPNALAKARRRWLQATYFLEGPSLGLLIDSSDDAEKTKRLVFARLLGFEELEKRDRTFRSVNRSLRRPILKLEGKCKALEQRHSMLLSQQGSNPSSASQMLERAIENIERVQRLFDTTQRSDRPDTPDGLEATRLALSKLNVATHNATETLDKQRQLRTELEVDILWIASTIESTRVRHEAVQQIEGSKVRNREKVEALHEDLNRRLEHRASLASRHKALVDLDSEIENLLAEVRHHFESWQGQASGPLREQLPILRVERSRRQSELERETTNRRQLTEFLDALSGLESQATRFSELSRDLEDLDRQLETATPRTKIDEELRRLFSEYREIDALQGKLSSALEHLRNANRDRSAMESERALAQAESMCPLCGHDHGTSENLRDAIDATLALTPESLRRNSERLAEIGRRQKELEAQRFEQEELLRRRENLDAERLEISRRVEDWATRHFEVLGSQIPEPRQIVEAFLSEENAPKRHTQRVSLTHNLEARSAHFGQRETSIGSRLVEIQELLSAGEKLETLGDAALPTLEARAQAEGLELAPLPTVSEHDLWEPWLQEVSALCEKEISGLKRALLELDAQANSLRRDLLDCIEQQERIDSRLERTTRELAEENVRLDKARRAAEALRLDFPPPIKDLENLRRKIDRRQKRLTRIVEHLEEAEACLDEVESTDRVQQELDEISRDLEIHRRSLGTIQDWSDQLEEARERIKFDRSGHILRQIKPLSSAITAFFQRAQGNPIIDDITTPYEQAGSDSPLDWSLRIGEKELSISHLSLGQRQDLALAIFLARARSLGGTFFLDEPLIHLDDLNRVALLDILRVLAIDQTTQKNRLHLVVTTASSQLTRHLREKFSLVPWSDDGVPPLRIYELDGGPRSGVIAREIVVPQVPL